jgi:octaprenyl-diphosphate synthase
MASVDRVIAAKLSTGVPLVGQVCEYIISAGGKRLRPALLLLVSGALGHVHENRHTLAAVIEFIHTATLLHDDVVDESTLRRGRETVNELFGNAASVLVGDFLYSRAFQMMVEVGHLRVMEVLAEVTNVIAEGEVQQLVNMRDAGLTEAAYLHVIRSKTAKLFEASACLAAIVSGQTPSIEAACANYGQALGTAFQVIDDVLDYEGSSGSLGKNLGDDLREGKVTLPMIHALQRANEEQRLLLTAAIEEPLSANLNDVLGVIRQTGAIESSRSVAWLEAQRAIDALTPLPDNRFRSDLIELAAMLQSRQG